MTERASIASVLAEFERQPELLASMMRSSRWSALSVGPQPILVGAGDSYAAALSASCLAGSPVLAFDPYSLAESLAWAKGRPVYLISISGQTRSNIALAQALRGVAKKTTALTSNPASRLASAVDEVFELPFRPTKSPGVATFTLSLAAAMKVCGVDPRCDFRGAFSRAAALSRKVLVAKGRGVTHFAANNEGYGASVYGAAKVYELTGGRAQVSLLEEFSHMPLFSLSGSDAVNVADSSAKGQALHDNLRHAGYSSSLLRCKGTRIEVLYSLVFAMQRAAIDAARNRGLEAPYFLGARKKLRISDAMIY